MRQNLFLIFVLVATILPYAYSSGHCHSPDWYTTCASCLNDSNSCNSDFFWCPRTLSCLNSTDLEECPSDVPIIEASSCPIVGSATGASLSATGRFLDITFSVATNQAGNGGNCTDLFQGAALNWLGSGAVCTYPTPQSLRVEIGTPQGDNRPFVVGDEITLTTAIYGADGVGMRNLTQTIQPPSKPVALTVRSGNQTVGSCSTSWTVDADVQGPHFVRKTWSVVSVPDGFTSDELEELNDLVSQANTNNSDTFTFDFNAALILPENRTNGEIVLSMDASSTLGQDKTAKFYIVLTNSELPTVAITSAPAEWISGEPLVVRGSASNPCNNDSVSVQWSVDPSVSLSITNRTTLTVPAKTLRINTNYTFTLTATFNGNSASDQAVVFIEPVPLRASLRPLSTTIGLDTGAVVFNASRSSDPNNATAVLTYSWSCAQRVGEGTVSCSNALEQLFAATTGSALTIPQGTFDGEDPAEYEVLLTVSSASSNLSAVAIGTIRVIDDIVPQIKAINQLAPAVVTTPLTFPSRGLSLPVASVNKKGYLGLQASVNASSATNATIYEWTAVRQAVIGDDLNQVSSDSENVTLTSALAPAGTDRTGLTVDLSKLSVNYLYTFHLSARFAGADEAATSSYQIVVNAGPADGILALSGAHNANGTYNLLQAVTLTTSGWVDLNEPITYSFGTLLSNGKTIPLRPFGSSNTMTTKALPAGTQWVYVIARDSLGATTTANATVGAINVVVPSRSVSETLTEIDSQLADLDSEAESDPEGALAQIAVLSDLLDDVADDGNATEASSAFDNLALNIERSVSNLISSSSGSLSSSQLDLIARSLGQVGRGGQQFNQSTTTQTRVLDSMSDALDATESLSDGLSDDAAGFFVEALSGTLRSAANSGSSSSVNTVKTTLISNTKKLLSSLNKGTTVGVERRVASDDLTLVANRKDVGDTYSLSDSGAGAVDIPGDFVTSGLADGVECESVVYASSAFNQDTNPFGDSTESPVLDMSVSCTDANGDLQSVSISGASDNTDIELTISATAGSGETTTCFFYDTDNNNALSTEGVTTTVVGTTVTCSTNHLTPFTVSNVSGSDSSNTGIIIGIVGGAFVVGVLVVVVIKTNSNKKKRQGHGGSGSQQEMHRMV